MLLLIIASNALFSKWNNIGVGQRKTRLTCFVIEIISFCRMKFKQVHADPDLTFVLVLKHSFQFLAMHFCMDDTESLWDQQG